MEPVWGLLEVARYVAIVHLSTTLLVAIYALVMFACFQSLHLFYYTPICGLSAGGIAALVSLKQFLPDSIVFQVSVFTKIAFPLKTAINCN